MTGKISLRPGDRKELTIESIAPGGEGVSKDLGWPIFIEKVAVGDKVLVEIMQAKSSFARAKLLKVLSPSPDRIEPACQLFDRCGGCQWQHLSYPVQIKAKTNIIRQSFHHLANLPVDAMRAVVEASAPLFYRNKVHFLARPTKGERSFNEPGESLQLGYFAAGSHNLIDINHCPVQPSSFDAVINLVRHLCHKFAIAAYDEEKGKGLLRSVSVRQSKDSGEILVTLVLHCDRGNISKRVSKLARQLLVELPEITGVCANFHTKPGSNLFGEETICLVGKPHIIEICRSKQVTAPEQLRQGVSFQLSPTSFFQINTEQATKMLDRIQQIVQDFSTEQSLAQADMTVLDAYAGVGAIALWLAPSVGKVVAIEENFNAVKDAEINLGLNDIKNVDFYAGKVEDVLPPLIEEGFYADIVVIDPPRKGCARGVLEEIIKLAPKLIIYVSCNPVTLARDLKVILARNNEFTGGVRNNEVFGYNTKQILPIDFFPQTYHIESITVLERQLSNDEDGNVEKARARSRRSSC